MNDRHQELRRQYDLLREHLVWLEREIAREARPSGNCQSETAIPMARLPAPAPMPSPNPTAAPADAEVIFKDYAETERHDPKATKKGCLLAFGLVLGMLIVSVAAVYFVFYAHH